MEGSTNMYTILNDLSESQFKKFRMYLREGINGVFEPIPWDKLEKADVTDTVHLMEERYGNKHMEVARHILNTLGRQDLVEHLGESSQDFSGTRTGGPILRGCKSCAEVPESSHWVLVEPEVSTEKWVSTYSLSSPAGCYECSESGLRWSCAGPVTLQYCFIDWNIFAAELAHMQYSPAGPLMDIKLMSGELEKIHLPHFLCLGGVEASVCDAVRVLHGRESGVCVEVCELTRHHAKLLQPSLSSLGVLYKATSKISPMRVHSKVLVYQCNESPLVFRSYLLPEDAYLKQAVKRDEKTFGGVWRASPHPPGPLQIHHCYSLATDCASKVYPEQLTLRYSSGTPNFFQVRLLDPVSASFHMQLFSSATSTGQPVWTAEFQTRSRGLTEGVRQHPSRAPVELSSEEMAAFIDENRPVLVERVTEVVSIAEQLLSRKLIGRETYANIQAAATSPAQMRAVFEGLRSAGHTGKLALYRILQEQQPHLLEELWRGSQELD